MLKVPKMVNSLDIFGWFSNTVKYAHLDIEFLL